MKTKIWKILAKFLAKTSVADYFIARAKRTPYQPILHPDGSLYMDRWWLFNPYQRVDNLPRARIEFTIFGKHVCFKFPYSARIHHIATSDLDREMHDHPWDARTIILKGWYTEKRPLKPGSPVFEEAISELPPMMREMIAGKESELQISETITRMPGDTATLNFGEYHVVTEVSEGGVYTLFITGEWKGDWGFWVNGKKIFWRDFLRAKGYDL